MQDTLLRTLNPIFDNPIVAGTQLTQITLISGTNVIDHKLDRNLLGWIITRKRANANIYDTQDTNPTPSKNLILVSDAPVVVDIYAY